jgi:hypothetical protein
MAVPAVTKYVPAEGRPAVPPNADAFAGAAMNPMQFWVHGRTMAESLGGRDGNGRRGQRRTASPLITRTPNAAMGELSEY